MQITILYSIKCANEMSGIKHYFSMLPNSCSHCPYFFIVNNQLICFSFLGKLNQTYVGCYADDENRVLEKRLPDSNSNTPSSCVKRCKRQKYPFAGVQFGKECFCGTNTFQRIGQVKEEKCNKECSGDRASFCGGFFHISIFTVPPSTCFYQ